MLYSGASRQCRDSRAVVLPSIAALILCCSQQIYAQSQPADSQGSLTVRGTVLNSVTHEPIGRAMVYTTDSRSATFTDDRGQFELSIAAPKQGAEAPVRFGPETGLQAKKPGFLSDQGASGRAFVRPTTKDVTLSLVPEALIVGQVKFPSSETADQAQVVLYRREVRDGFGGWERLSEVRTRSDGEYRFAELRAGQYKVFTLEAVDRDPLASGIGGPMYGFPPRFFDTAHDFATADTIGVHAGETVTANMTPERQRYYEVKIPVTAPQPADWGVMVTVYAQAHRGPGFELGYDRNQHAIRGSLPNGTYTIEASSTGPAAATGITNITIANGPVLGPLLTLTANPSIEINVRTELSGSESTQMPRPTATLTLHSADEFSEERGPNITNQSQDNPPTLQGVKPGRYWVEVQASWSNLYAASVTSGLTDLLRAPLVVQAGASVPPIEITLRDDTGDIEATVEGAPEVFPTGVSGTATYSGPMGRGFDVMGGISVYGIPLGDNGPVRWFNARVNERFRLQQVPPGDYRVLAFDSPHEFESRNPAAMRVYESKGQVVHVTAGKTTQVMLKPISSE